MSHYQAEATSSSNQLAAANAMSRSKKFTKQPSMSMTDNDSLGQLTQAPECIAAAVKSHKSTKQQPIITPELATDASSSSDSGQCSGWEPKDGQLIDEDYNYDELKLMQTYRRKRVGGSNTHHQKEHQPGGQQPKSRSRALSGKQSNLAEYSDVSVRATSFTTATQPDSVVSGGSIATRSTYGAVPPRATGNLRGAGGPSTEDTTALGVPFDELSSRRRSAIAFIPQMQICPGDLHVDNKQHNQLMKLQSQENESLGELLTADLKKAKSHIWSSLKLCAHFDSRTVRSRNELEDVLQSLQPVLFVDEQLSQYKGMSWNEFLCELESETSVSAEKMASPSGENDNNEEEESRRSTTTAPTSCSCKDDMVGFEARMSRLAEQQQSNRRRLGSKFMERTKTLVGSGERQPTSLRESVKATMSSSATPVKQTVMERMSLRSREKPRLNRAETVDSSMFRIPLTSSSSLKHAQQHQETPTAYVEHHSSEIVSIDEDERQPMSTGTSTGSSASASSRDVALEDLVNNGRPSGKMSLSTLSSTVSRKEQKRQQALWDLFQSECTFFFDHLMTLKDVYMEPLKKVQVENLVMFADPDVLFCNLDELCSCVYDFCKEFLKIITRTLRTRPEELNATDVLIKLYKENPDIDRLRSVYQRYTLKYIKALTHLECVRRQVEFVEFEKWASCNVRCHKLHLTDLLVAPVQHAMRVPIILRDIESYTEHEHDRDKIRAILAVEEASLKEMDDKMRWLENFERLREIQRNIIWPSVLDKEPKAYVPEELRKALSKQPCENLIASPRRQIILEGTLANFDLGAGKPSDLYVVLFDDMLLMMHKKKCLAKKASTICKTNLGWAAAKHHGGTFTYVVYKQPISLDRFEVRDVQQVHAQGIKNGFALIVFNRFQQFTDVHSFSAPDDDTKQTWLFKLKQTAEAWKRNNMASSNYQQ